MLSPQNPKLLVRVRLHLLRSGRSENTAKAYCRHIKSFIQFHKLRHPQEMHNQEVVNFLNHLYLDKGLSASAQNQALCALVWLYKFIIQNPLGELDAITWSKRPKKLPVVLSRSEARALIQCLDFNYWLIVCVLYGAGLRISECLNLRVEDLDFSRKLIRVNQGKGNKDRDVDLPSSLEPFLHHAIEHCRLLYTSDKELYAARQCGTQEFLQYELKIVSRIGLQFIFANDYLRADHKHKTLERACLTARSVNNAIKAAARNAGLMKQPSCHSFRHSYASHMIELGHNLRFIQLRLGHSSISTTQIYTHLSCEPSRSVVSPLDELDELDELDDI